METQSSSPTWRRWSLALLLLGLVMPPATAQALTYREAVLRAVDGFNQQSSEANLYRLLELDPLPEADENPGIPKPVSFTVKETVCPRALLQLQTTSRTLEQCDFKENGLVKQCVGRVTLDQADGNYDIRCDELQNVRFRGIRKLIRRVGKKIGRGLRKIGQGIRRIIPIPVPPEEES